MNFKEELDLVLEATPKDYMLRRSRRRNKRKKAANNLTQQISTAVQDNEPEKEEPEKDPGKDLKISQGKPLANIGRDKVGVYTKLKKSIEVSLGNIARLAPALKPQATEAAQILFRGITSQLDESKGSQLSPRDRAFVQQEVLKIYGYIKSIHQLLPSGPIRKNLRVFRDYIMKTFGALVR